MGASPHTSTQPGCGGSRAHAAIALRLASDVDLAREAAPKRVNAVAGDNEQAIVATLEWLAQAPGITGQLLAVE